MAKRAFKINKVSLDLANYYYYVRGVEKVGKTTLWRDLVLELFNGDASKGLLVSCGTEEGYKALDNIQAEQVESWEDFIDLVDYLVEEKNEHGIKFVCIDTYDELADLGVEEILLQHRRAKGTKVNSINEAFGGYNRGVEMLAEIIDKQLHRLKHCGLGLMILSHTKIRSIKEKGTQEEYMQLTTNLRNDIDAIVSHKADVIATCSIDRVIENGLLVGTKRFINFRSDGFINCGTRFANIPDRVELSAKNFRDAIEQGIKNSITIPMTEEELKKQFEIEKLENDKKAQQFIKKEKTLTNEDLVSEITKIVPTLPKELQDAVMKKIAGYEITSFDKPDTLNHNHLLDIYEMIK